jgi:hypothetical protein
MLEGNIPTQTNKQTNKQETNTQGTICSLLSKQRQATKNKKGEKI